MKNHKGFTLIELLVSIGLSVITISLVMSCFMINYKSYKYIGNEAELQFQSQYILNFMSDKIIESKCIEQIRYNTISHLKKTDKQNVTKISFRYGTESFECYNFEVRNNKIYYTVGSASSNVNVELGNYTVEMYVSPIPHGTIFEDARTIQISLVLENKNQTYEAEQTISMRND